MATETDKIVIEDIKAWIEIESSRIKEKAELTKAIEMYRKYYYLCSIQEEEEWDDDDVDSECSCDACNDEAGPVKQKQD